MTQYNALNVKLSNLQFSKIESGIINNTEVPLNLSSNVVGNSKDEANFSYKLLLTNTQVSKIHKPFTIGSSANIKFSKNSIV